MIRKSDAVDIFYSSDGISYPVGNITHFPAHIPVKTGMLSASPEDYGFKAVFEHIKITDKTN